MKIGVSTITHTGSRGYEKLSDLVGNNFKHIEFYNQVTRIRAGDVDNLLFLKRKNDLSYTLHSLSKDLFCPDKVISDANFYFLKGEIKLASLINGQRVVFHISKEKRERLTDHERNKLVALISYANKNKIKLCLENNSSEGIFSTDYVSDLINRFKNLYFCLDVGHLNIASKKEYIRDINAFLAAVKHKTLQIHLHYNNGFSDQHEEFNEIGMDYLKQILRHFNINRMPLVIEARNINKALLIRSMLNNIRQKNAKK